MFGRRFELFKVFGFAVRLDLSWFIIAVLVTWSLADSHFPAQIAGLATATYWWMGATGALGLFASIVVHELAHAIVARRFGLVIRGITLFIFGGVAEMENEPPSPKAEFLVAIAGPIASLLLCLLFLLLSEPAPLLAGQVLSYLAWINGVLVIFNMVPAFPLDGGRVLRSALWQWRGSLRRATRTTSRLGNAFGMVLILFGVLSLIGQAVIAGIWFFLIGLFVRGAAQMSYQQLLIRDALAGEPVRRFMKDQPLTVPRAISVAELVEDYVYQHHFKMWPVVDGDRLLGCVTTRQVRELPRAEWERTSVGALASPCSPDNTTSPDTDTLEALNLMNKTKQSRLMVVDGDRLVGLLTLKDLLQFLALKVELEGDAE